MDASRTRKREKTMIQKTTPINFNIVLRQYAKKQAEKAINKNNKLYNPNIFNNK